jgi:hypothetical protein
MASKARHDIEAAVAQLLDMASADASSVPVLMALAHGFLLLKQTAKARNQLKVGGCGCGVRRHLSLGWLCKQLAALPPHRPTRRRRRPLVRLFVGVYAAAAACVQAAVRAGGR